MCQLPVTQQLKLCILQEPAIVPDILLLPGLLHTTLYILMKQMMQHSALADHPIQRKKLNGYDKTSDLIGCLPCCSPVWGIHVSEEQMGSPGGNSSLALLKPM